MGICDSKEKNPNTETPKQKTKTPPPTEQENLRSLPPKKEEPKSITFIITETHSNKTYKEVTINARTDQTLEELFADLTYNRNADYEIFFTDYKEDLTNKLQQKISDLFNIENYCDKPIKLECVYQGLEIPDDVLKAYATNTNLVGSIILDNPDMLGIITYNVKEPSNDKKMNPFYFNKNDNENLRKFNSFSAYCNGQNKIFLSGGECDLDQSTDKSVTKYNEFYCIDLNNLIETGNLDYDELPSLNEVRTWHSMIYVPDNYIFIVGGSNTKKVELYNIQTKELTVDSELNIIRSEPTLCLVNDSYLYCFCGFLLHQSFHDTVERCNLRKKQRQWENVLISTPNDIKFVPSFFGVTYSKDNNIILVGGNDNIDENNKSYIFCIEEGLEGRDDVKQYDVIKDYDIGTNLICVFRDKFFMPISQNAAVNIPLPAGDSVQIMTMNFDDGKISKAAYKLVFE